MSAEDAKKGPAPLSRALVFLPVVIAAALGLLFFWGLRNQDDALPSALLGQPAPEFTLPPVGGAGEGFATADLRGDVSLVNFWASWCAPCREEMPLLVELAEAGTVRVHGINYKDNPEAALAFLDEVGNPFDRLGADATGRAGLDWGVYGMPETFVVDAEGRIAYKHVGPFTRRIFDETILPVILRLRAEGGGA